LCSFKYFFNVVVKSVSVPVFSLTFLQKVVENFLCSDGDLLLQEWGVAGKIDMMDYGGSLVTRAVMFCNQVT
jgi:hypothetical protein